MGRGYNSLVEKVKSDCNNGEGCFNPGGCNHEFIRREPAVGAEKEITDTVHRRISKCGHKYCDKFKWIIDRAKHYEEKTGISWEEILNSWEEGCNYWYMNYYQDCNQPLLEGDRARVFETLIELGESVGDKGFRCPYCGGISTNPYDCDTKKMVDGKECDWKVYGFFGDLGKGVYVFCKDIVKGGRIFMPISWE